MAILKHSVARTPESTHFYFQPMADGDYSIVHFYWLAEKTAARIAVKNHKLGSRVHSPRQFTGKLLASRYAKT